MAELDKSWKNKVRMCRIEMLEYSYPKEIKRNCNNYRVKSFQVKCENGVLSLWIEDTESDKEGNIEVILTGEYSDFDLIGDAFKELMAKWKKEWIATIDGKECRMYA